MVLEVVVEEAVDIVEVVVVVVVVVEVLVVVVVVVCAPGVGNSLYSTMTAPGSPRLFFPPAPPP